MTTNERRPLVYATTPNLLVADLPRAVDFYCRVLGFAQPSVYGDPPCFAMLQRSGFSLFLSAREGARATPNGPHGVWDVYMKVADVAAEQRAIVAAGGALASGPTDTFYQMREIELDDPDGHRWCLAQDLTG